MTDFLMRMVSRAAGASPTLKPRLPYQFAWPAAPDRGLRQFPRSDAAGSDNFGGPVASAGFGLPEVESFVEGPTARSSMRQRQSPTIHELQATARRVAQSTVFGTYRAVNSEVRGEIDQRIPERQDDPNAAGEFADAVNMQAAPSLVPTNTWNAAEPSEAILVNQEQTSHDSRMSEPAGRLQSVQFIETEQPSRLPKETRGRQPRESAADIVPVTNRVESLPNHPLAPVGNIPSAALARQRPETREAEQPVEVKIGRVEVTFEPPPQPAAARRPAPRGFDEYTALRRYSPQAWNRWRR